MYKEKFTTKKVVFAMRQNIYRTKQRYFAWKQENDPAELTEISFCNKNALGKNEYLQTYSQNILSKQEIKPELYSSLILKF